MWARADGFHYVWKKVEGGDVTLTADIAFTGTGKAAHRKGVLMIRQNLGADGAYADAALHGDGLTSLQSREANGELTHEIQANTAAAPKRLRISKRGDRFYMSVSPDAGAEPRFTGGWMEAKLTAPFYVGIGVCSHDKDTVEKLVFTNVTLETAPSMPVAKPVRYSTLETIAVASTDRRVTHVSRDLLQSPSYTRDGASLIFASQGRLVRIAAAGGGAPAALGAVTGPHALSPDGARIAFAGESKRLFAMPAAGGAATKITAALKAPVQGLAWSPDGKMLLVSAGRNAGLYTLPAEGGGKPAKIGQGQDPAYSPDGQFIYFASARSGGSRQIWRMKADGAGAEQVTTDEMENWSPRISPDGRQMAFLSAEKGSAQPRMRIRTMLLLGDKTIRTLAKLAGGAPAWSPDSRRLTFVSYQELPPQE